MKKNIIDDGLSIFFALQGNGKTYVCTDKAIKEIINPKSVRKVLSNYPIIVTIPLTFKQKVVNRILDHYKSDTHKFTFTFLNKSITLNRYRKETKSSLVWNDEYTNAQFAIKDALVIIDEGHDKYTGSYAYELTKQDRMFFSRLRHNNIAVFIMSQSYEDIHPFLRRRLAFLHEVSKVKHFWKKTPSCFNIDTYTSIKNYLRKDDHKTHKKTKPTRLRHEKIQFSLLTATAYNTHYFRNIGKEPIYESWYNKIQGIDTNPTIKEPIIVETISSVVVKESISTLMRLNKWKKGDATIEVNKIIIDNDISEVNTTEKIIRIALQRRLDRLEEKKEEKVTNDFDFEENN